MKFQITDSFNISDDVLSQEVNGETVLLDLDGECYFGLNEVGTSIWQLLGSKQTLAEILETLSDKYDVSRENLESDVNDLLDKLNDAGLITRIGLD